MRDRIKDSIKESFGSISLLFIAVLFFFSSIIAWQTHINLKEGAEKKLLRTLEESLDKVIADTSAESYINQIVINAKKYISKLDTNWDYQIQNLSNYLLKASKEAKIKAFIYKKAELVNSFGNSSEDLDLFEDLMMQLLSPEELFLEAQKVAHNKVLDYFGPGNRLELIKGNKSCFVRYFIGDDKGYYFWDVLPDDVAFFIVITELPSFITRFKSNYSGSDSFGAADPILNDYSPPASFTVDQMAVARKKAILEGKTQTSIFDKLWFFVEDKDGQYWTRILDESKLNKTYSFWSIAIFYFVLFNSIIFTLAYFTNKLSINPGEYIAKWLDSISLRYRIAGIFIFFVFIPVIITLLIGITSLATHSEIIENQAISDSMMALQRIENIYHDAMIQAQEMHNELRDYLKKSPPTKEIYHKFLDRYSFPHYLARLEVRNIKGDILLTFDDPLVHGVTVAMDVFNKLAMKQHIPERLGDRYDKVTPGELITESILSSDESGMASILRQRGKVWRFRVGTYPTLWYWDVFTEADTEAAFMWSAFQYISIYRKRIELMLSSQTLASPNFQMAVELNPAQNSLTFVPEIKGYDTDELLNAAITCSRTQKILLREIKINNEEYWVTIKPEKSIGTHIILNLTSKNKRLKALIPIKWRLALNGFLALLISTLGASLLTKLILMPIKDISHGIKAIEEKNEYFRIPIRRQDEFGVLSSEFNKVIADFKELQYGRLIQESLLPSNIDSPLGFDLACFTTPATDLAGDYHDVVKLNDGKIAIILGDVTGHGISASLAMAMAKATVSYTKNDSKLFPEPLMECLNSLFNKELKPENKFMTLVTLVLDPKSGQITVANAGQSFPKWYKHNTQKSQDIEIPSMPLGAMKKRIAKPLTITIEPKDGILLYTDGIVESTNSKGEMYGYNQLSSTFENLMSQNLSSEDILKEMMKTLDEFRVPGAYEDDVTLVLLRRL